MPEINELEWLRRRSSNRRTADFVHALDELGLSPIEAARKAGYSAGRSEEPKAQNVTLSTTASRALKSRRVERLRKDFDDYRTKKNGEQEPEIASQEEVLATLTKVLRSSKDAAVVQSATRLLDAFKRGASQPKVTLDHVPELVNRLCNSELLLFQIAGVQYGLSLRGSPSMQDWQVPEHLQRIEQLTSELGLSPLQVLNVVSGKHEVKVSGHHGNRCFNDQKLF